MYGIPSIIKYLLITPFFFVSLNLYLKNKPKWLLNKLDKLFYIIFTFYTLLLLLLSIRFEIFYLQEFFASSFFALPFIIPLFLFSLPYDLEFIKKYTYYASKGILLSLPIIIGILLTLNSEFWLLHYAYLDTVLFGFPLLYLFMSLRTNLSIKITYYFIIISFLFIFAYYGRRSVVFDYFFILLFQIAIEIKSKNISLSKKITKFLFIFSVTLISTTILFNRIAGLHFFERGVSIEAWEESRGTVVQDFFDDFTSTNDWIFGRGLNGLVKRSYNESGLGNGIENGYLQLILKAGNLYFSILLYFFFRAFYLGWYKTNNDLTRALAALLIIHLLGLVGFNVPGTNHRYLLLWVAIPICFSPYFRALTNLQVKKLIIDKKYK